MPAGVWGLLASFSLVMGSNQNNADQAIVFNCSGDFGNVQLTSVINEASRKARFRIGIPAGTTGLSLSLVNCGTEKLVIHDASNAVISTAPTYSLPGPSPYPMEATLEQGTVSTASVSCHLSYKFSAFNVNSPLYNCASGGVMEKHPVGRHDYDPRYLRQVITLWSDWMSRQDPPLVPQQTTQLLEVLPEWSQWPDADKLTTWMAVYSYLNTDSVEGLTTQEVKSGADHIKAAEFLKQCSNEWREKFPGNFNGAWNSVAGLQNDRIKQRGQTGGNDGAQFFQTVWDACSKATSFLGKGCNEDECMGARRENVFSFMDVDSNRIICKTEFISVWDSVNECPARTYRDAPIVFGSAFGAATCKAVWGSNGIRQPLNQAVDTVTVPSGVLGMHMIVLSESSVFTLALKDGDTTIVMKDLGTVLHEIGTNQTNRLEDTSGNSGTLTYARNLPQNGASALLEEQIKMEGTTTGDMVFAVNMILNRQAMAGVAPTNTNQDPAQAYLHYSYTRISPCPSTPNGCKNTNLEQSRADVLLYGTYLRSMYSTKEEAWTRECRKYVVGVKVPYHNWGYGVWSRFDAWLKNSSNLCADGGKACGSTSRAAAAFNFIDRDQSHSVGQAEFFSVYNAYAASKVLNHYCAMRCAAPCGGVGITVAQCTNDRKWNLDRNGAMAISRLHWTDGLWKNWYTTNSLPYAGFADDSFNLMDTSNDNVIDKVEFEACLAARADHHVTTPAPNQQVEQVAEGYQNAQVSGPVDSTSILVAFLDPSMITATTTIVPTEAPSSWSWLTAFGLLLLAGLLAGLAYFLWKFWPNKTKQKYPPRATRGLHSQAVIEPELERLVDPLPPVQEVPMLAINLPAPAPITYMPAPQIASTGTHYLPYAGTQQAWSPWNPGTTPMGAMPVMQQPNLAPPMGGGYQTGEPAQ